MNEKAKTTMSVSEMQRMLGLCKTESYWLVHRGYFDTIYVAGKIRVVIESFEKWYANQIKWHKVDGDPPGQELRSYSYSIREMAELLSVDESVAYDIVKRFKIETFTAGTWKRVRKDVFEAWYNSQSRYRTLEDRERDAAREAATMTMPEMARLLMISRKEVYNILAAPQNEGVFEFEVIAGRRRVTKESFDRWYAGQDKYCKLQDLPPEEQAHIEKLKQEAEMPRLKVADDKPSYDLQETAILLDISYRDVSALIRDGHLEARQFGRKKYVLREDIQWFLLQQHMNIGKED